MVEFLNILKEHWSKFDTFFVGREKEIIEELLALISCKNRKVKENSSDTLESFMENYAKQDRVNQREFVSFFVGKFKHIINKEEDPVLVMVAIRCFGHLASVIKRCLGQEELQTQFLLLFEISQSRVLNDMTDSYKNVDSDAVLPENFKKILYRQKQLNSHIKAFALIVKEMNSLSEHHAKHLLELFMIGSRKHKLFFEGYKKYLYSALVLLFNSMYIHEEVYKFWSKKAIGEMLTNFIEMPIDGRELYDQDVASIRSGAEFIVRMLKQDGWVEEVKNDFIKGVILGFQSFFESSEYGYDEIQGNGKKVCIPHSYEDQHLTLRLALIFEESQRTEVFDQCLPEHLNDFMNVVSKSIQKYPRTTSLLKLLRSLLVVAERKSDVILVDSPDSVLNVKKILESLFTNLRELRGDILMDYLRCLMATPSYILRNSPKHREIYRRAVIITLEFCGPQTIFMIDHVVSSLERTLVKEKVDLKEEKEQFLQTILPFFAGLLDIDLTKTRSEEIYTLTVQENNLDKQMVLKKCITFLGSLGSDLLYMAKGTTKDNELEHNDGDTLKVSLPISKHRIMLNLNHLIKRTSQLAIESPNTEVQSAACEMFHASLVILIGKCSQGSQGVENFVEAIESSIPSILSVATGANRFASLFRELLLQMARWLSLNKEEDNPLVSVFIGNVLSLAGSGDKPEVRSLCLESLEQFLASTLKVHLRPEIHIRNFGILFRKIEGFTLHPDLFKRLAGLMCLKLVVGQLATSEALLKNLFFEVVFYFFLFIRKQEVKSSGDLIVEDTINFCEQIFNQIESLLKLKASKLDQCDNESAKYTSINDLFVVIQKNLFSPEAALRQYSVKLWVVIRGALQSFVTSSALANSFNFLNEGNFKVTDDPLLSLKALVARCSTISTLIEAGILSEKHFREHSIFQEILSGSEMLTSPAETALDSDNKIIQQTEDIKKEGVMILVHLAGLLRAEEKTMLLKSVKTPELVKSVISSTFKNSTQRDVQLALRVLDVLDIDRPEVVKEFVNNHEFRFDSARDPIYSFTRKIMNKDLESFFNTILSLLSPEEIQKYLLNSVRIYHMLKFVKGIKKITSSEIVTRAKVMLTFLLNTNSLQDSEIAEFLDPFKPTFDNFSAIVQTHISKNPEQSSSTLISYLFQKCRNDHNVFSSIIDLLSIFVANDKDTKYFFVSFNQTFDSGFIRAHDLLLQNIMNLAIIFLQERKELNFEQIVTLVEQSLQQKNRSTIGLLGIEMMAHYARVSSHESVLLMYRRVKNLLSSYSQQILPAILDDKFMDPKDWEKIDEYSTKIVDFIVESKSLEAIEVIFPLIRNNQRFKSEIGRIVEMFTSNGSYDILLTNVRFCMKIFEDKEISQSLEYNIRFSIITRVLLPLLESMKEQHMQEVFIETYHLLKQILNQDSLKEIPAREKVLQFSEKACAFNLIELFFRKLSSTSIKEVVHPRIIGGSTQKNEITKEVIVFCNSAKKVKRTEVEAFVKKSMEAEDPTKTKFCLQSIFDYYCAAYNCLVSVLIGTQTKEGPFNKFLLTSEVEKGEYVLENLIDLNFTYNFKPSTNFESENLQDYYKVEVESGQKTSSKYGLKHFVAKLTADSLFTQNINRGRLVPEGFSNQESQKQQLINLLNSSQEASQEPDTAHKMDVEIIGGHPQKIEIDDVNRHPIMRSLLRLVDFMDTNFTPNRSEDTMPSWISLFLRMLNDHSELNYRILLLKVMINRATIFKPYREHFNQFILEYLATSQTGGVGFHYFMRDTCVTFITWNTESTLVIKGGDALQKRLCYDSVRNLCKKLADAYRPLFLLNIEIFQSICHVMKKDLRIDPGLVFNMLVWTERKNENTVEQPTQAQPLPDEVTSTSVLWRLAALSILETAINEQIPITHLDTPVNLSTGSGGSGDNTMTQTVTLGSRATQRTMSQDRIGITSSVSMDIEMDSVLVTFHEKLLKAVQLNMRIMKKKSLCTAGFRLAGLYLNYLYNRLPYSHTEYEAVKTQIVKEIDSMIKKRDYKYIEECICEMCLVFPEFAVTPIITSELTAYVIKTNGKTRAYVFTCLRVIIARCLEKPQLMRDVASNIVLSLRSSLKDILRDSDPNNILEFLKTLIEVSKLMNTEVISFFNECLTTICATILKLLKPEDQHYFFDFIVLVHENYTKEFAIIDICKRYMILGLSNTDEAVRNQFYQYLSSGSKKLSTEEGVLEFILRDLYNQEYEQFWLTTSAQMVIALSKTSAQAEQLIFDRPLTGYVSSGLLTLSNRNNLSSQMSQPLIPMSLIASSQHADFKTPMIRQMQSQDFSENKDISEAKAKLKYAQLELEKRTESEQLDDERISAIFNSSEAETFLSKASKVTGSKAHTSKKENRKNADIKSFFKQNKINFNQFSQTDNNLLRFTDRQGIIQKKQDIRYQTIKKSDQLQHVYKTLREYKLGDLPDIQIKWADLLKPMGVLVSQDPKMAQLVFVPLFIEVHKHQIALANQVNFKYLLKIIDQSHSNFQVINTVQTILYELSLDCQTLDLDPSLICKTGTGSLSFGGAALLLEDMLAKSYRSVKDQEIHKETTKATVGDRRPYVDDQKFMSEVKDKDTMSLILSLVEIYKQMNDEDTLRGLYRQLHQNDKQANDVFDLKLGKKTNLSLKKLDELISSTADQLINDNYKRYLEHEKRENLYQLNKWEDLVSEIRYDRHYLSCFKENSDRDSAVIPIITDMGEIHKSDRYYLLRGMLFEDQYWETLRQSAEEMLANPQMKNMFEKDYPYELSLLSVAMLEFDRSKFFLEKFKDKFLKNWTGVKDFANLQTKAEVVSELLRQHELKEFLICTRHYNIQSIEGSPDFDKFIDTMNSWLKRKSSATLNNFNYISDSFHSRILFIDTMKERYTQEFDESLYIKQFVSVSLEYSRDLLQMGFMDTADKILAKAYTRKEKFLAGDNSLDYEFTSLTVQSKLDGIERDINFISRTMDESNIDLKFLSSKFNKVNQFMDYWMNKKSQEDIDFYDKVKFSLLQLKIRTREVGAIRDYLGSATGNQDIELKYLDIINTALPEVKSALANIAEKEMHLMVIENQGMPEIELLKSKLLKTGCNVTENLLRWYKNKADEINISLQDYSNRYPEASIEDTAWQLIKFTADLSNTGNHSPSKVLFVLEITAEFSNRLGSHFNDCFSRVPCWIYLKWIPQIMSYMNSDSGSCFIPLIERLVTLYPEPMVYALSVATDTSAIFKEVNPNIEQLRKILETRFSADSPHIKFIRAMEHMLHPDQRLRSWLDCIEENVNKPERLQIIKNRMVEDVFSQVDPIVGEGIGDFNKKFIKEMERHIFKYFGQNFDRLANMKPQDILNASGELYQKADSYVKAKTIVNSASSFKTKLSAFSGWLSEYDINNYRRHSWRIEIPGQYSGDREPIPDLHIKVSYFMPEVLVIQSIRKPKRLTMLGTDEKVYHSLVKGGEDLRLDQRIEQLFSLMNEIFTKDPDCTKREFNIGTFNVIPIKKNLGVMEWVKNTMPLKSIIEKEMKKDQDILQNNAYIKRTGLLKQLARGKDIREQHLALLSANRETIVTGFNDQLKHFKSDMLKIAIKKKVQNAEQFVRIRKSFISNYAVLSLGSYILGVGDRHLDNFLFDCSSGKVIPIDFGYSFGFGLGLFIPELMPFRLTQNFVEMTYPLGLQGIFRNSMIFALKALKKKRHVITDTCEVFIRDPLTDWVKIVKSKNTSKNSQQAEELARVYPKDKLTVVDMKLSGHSPVSIMLHELESTRHNGQPYYSKLIETVNGAERRHRHTLREGILPLCDQVDCLIDMSTDPDILGRTWTGWAPYA